MFDMDNNLWFPPNDIKNYMATSEPMADLLLKKKKL